MTSEYPKIITDLHLELTDKCQASCPMCARNYNGGTEKDFVGTSEITLENFKIWFPKEFLESLTNIYACGNYGDPIIAGDCLEIFQYIRSVNPRCRLGLHTNGSARSVAWWKKLAKIFTGNSQVIFGIDGFAGSHELYRKGTSFEKIIENATAFINEGGTAWADTLLFKHNQNQIEDLKIYLKDLGFENHNIITTKRFYDMKKFPVYDKIGNTEYYLEESDIKTNEIKISLETLKTELGLKNFLKAEIDPVCIKEKTIYVDAKGSIYPCCYVGSDTVEVLINESTIYHQLRNNLISDTKSLMKLIGTKNLHTQSLYSILNNKSWDHLKESWKQEYKPMTCVKNCTKKLYDYRK